MLVNRMTTAWVKNPERSKKVRHRRLTRFEAKKIFYFADEEILLFSRQNHRKNSDVSGSHSMRLCNYAFLHSMTKSQCFRAF